MSALYDVASVPYTVSLHYKPYEHINIVYITSLSVQWRTATSPRQTWISAFMCFWHTGRSCWFSTGVLSTCWWFLKCKLSQSITAMEQNTQYLEVAWSNDKLAFPDTYSTFCFPSTPAYAHETGLWRLAGQDFSACVAWDNTCSTDWNTHQQFERCVNKQSANRRWDTGVGCLPGEARGAEDADDENDYW